MSGLENRRVLVVDDEEDLRDILQFSFERVGMEVVVAENAVDATEVLKKEAIDVVVSDIRMPGGDGFTLIKEIKSLGLSVPVIIVTGSEAFIDHNWDALGVAKVLGKPFTRDELMEAVTEVLEKAA